MHSIDVRASAVGAPIGRPRAFRLFRILLLPLLLNFWPALLFVSQKAFVPISLIINGLGDDKYRRDLLISISIVAVGFSVYVTQSVNSFQENHAIGFLIFVLSMPLINYSVRLQQHLLLKFLTYLTLFNAILGIQFLVNDVDLEGLRGLNRIASADGYTERIFFESASLAALFAPSFFNKRIYKIAATFIVLLFLIFVAKSIVVLALMIVNFSWSYFVRASIFVKAVVVFAVFFASYLLYMYIPILRPDIYLSILAKERQWDTIIAAWQFTNAAWGWGAFIPELATSIEQPYQIEMQLPMLFLQMGLLPATLFALLTLSLFISTAESNIFAFLRFFVYLCIGFNNPWLLIPSWYLTCQLLFRKTDNFL